jgi:hypothetical protein
MKAKINLTQDELIIVQDLASKEIRNLRIIISSETDDILASKFNDELHIVKNLNERLKELITKNK